MFNCTVVGGGTTLWTGTAFDCAAANIDEILLRHNNFNGSDGAFGECNNGDIVGRSVQVEGNCYTSQLIVTVSAGLNNKSVRCVHSTNEGDMITIGETLLTVISGDNVQWNLSGHEILSTLLRCPLVREQLLWLLYGWYLHCTAHALNDVTCLTFNLCCINYEALNTEG